MGEVLPLNDFLPNANGQVLNQFIGDGFLVCMAALVMLMTPGLGIFYSGMARAKNSLSLVMICFLCLCIVNIQYLIWGFSLNYSQNGTPFIGNAYYFGYSNVNQYALGITAPGVSSAAFVLYQLQFAVVTPAIIFGAVAERCRMVPSMIFVIVWSTLVYDICAYWVWAARGWLKNLACLNLAADLTLFPCLIGAYDFAGGGPVHITSGFSGLAFCLFLGRRKNVDKHLPHNLLHMFIGTGLLWFGWMGFNGGSALAANAKAAIAALNTLISSSVAGLTWVLFDYAFLKKLSGLSLCSGVIGGLVAITPASGFVAPWAAIVIGLIGGFATNIFCRLKPVFTYDDTLDAFGIHGIGGFVGLLLCGIFCQSWVIALDGTVAPGGAIDGNGLILLYNLIEALTIAAWSFLMTFLILWLISRVPTLHFRSSTQQEVFGDDWGEMGEINDPSMKIGQNPELEGGQEVVPAAPRLRGFMQAEDSSQIEKAFESGMSMEERSTEK